MQVSIKRWVKHGGVECMLPETGGNKQLLGEQDFSLAVPEGIATRLIVGLPRRSTRAWFREL